MNTLIYCYDAYCGWCYGFSPVMKKLMQEYGNRLQLEVYSGGMITGDRVTPIDRIAHYILSTYPRVEEMTGVKFGSDYLWHMENPDKSDWVLNSEKPAIALCIFKELFPTLQLEFASDLQYALHYEGRDLDDDEAYRHLLVKYGIPKTDFYNKLKSEHYKQEAHYEFALCKQLQATGFPTVLLQTGATRFHLIATGYLSYESIQKQIEFALQETNRITSH